MSSILGEMEGGGGGTSQAGVLRRPAHLSHGHRSYSSSPGFASRGSSSAGCSDSFA